MAEVTSNGIVQKTESEYIQEIQDSWKEIFGENLNTDPDTPQGQLINLLGLIAGQFDQQIVDVGRSLDIFQAQGQQLSDLTSILGTFRRDAAKSSTAATLSGTVGAWTNRIDVAPSNHGRVELT